MTVGNVLPSQVLNKPFVLNVDHNVTVDDTAGEESTAFWTHGYKVSGLGLLLPEGVVGEVFDELPMCRLPNTSNWLHGMASQRGNVVPVFDLAKVFGLEEAENQKERKYFLIGQREKTVGILIDEMPSRVFLNRKDMLTVMPPLPSQLQSFATASYQQGEQVWFDWDVDSFFMKIGEQI